MNESGQRRRGSRQATETSLSSSLTTTYDRACQPGKSRAAPCGPQPRLRRSPPSATIRGVRIGIGHPGDKALVYHYVLSDFAKAEAGWVEAVCRAIAEAAPLLVAGQDASFQNKTHLAIEAAGFGEESGA